MVKLRGHHLICLNFYDGDGIDEMFKHNVEFIKKKLIEGEDIKIVKGPDDICMECKYLKNQICNFSADSETEVKNLDEKALNFLNLKKGVFVNFNELKRKASYAPLEFYKDFCNGCSFMEYCKCPVKI